MLRTWREHLSITLVSCAHLRVSGSPPLFVKRWTSLAVWRAFSRTGERLGEREEGDNSFTLRTKRSGNHPGDRNTRPRGEVGVGLLSNNVHQYTAEVRFHLRSPIFFNYFIVLKNLPWCHRNTAIIVFLFMVMGDISQGDSVYVLEKICLNHLTAMGGPHESE